MPFLHLWVGGYGRALRQAKPLGPCHNGSLESLLSSCLIVHYVASHWCIEGPSVVEETWQVFPRFAYVGLFCSNAQLQQRRTIVLVVERGLQALQGIV
jgi:hypothetical protein